MRILSIDLGQKRIGIAVTDKLNKISYPLTVIENDNSAKEKIERIIKDYNINKIVVGFPYNLKGRAGYQAKIVDKFIENNLRALSIPIIKIDERFTSKIAENAVKELKKNSNKSKKCLKNNNVDKISASIILNEYLEKFERF